MTDPRKIAFAVLTATVVLGTAYSVAFNTYLDTSDPSLTSAPHPLTSTHYFASKSNFLNSLFIKKAWGWTTGLFFFAWGSSPPHTRTTRRLIQWLIATSVWISFTIWFFGPSLFDRFLVTSGGTCMINLPSGENITLPTDACFTKVSISPSSHPELFSNLTVDLVPVSDWNATPRLRSGHDVSGHIFLLTLSTLFLADQLRPSLSLPIWTLIHKLAFIGNVLLITIWLLASGTTSVYFHSPMEKVTGYLLGLLGFLLTQLVPSSPTPTRPPSVDRDEKHTQSR